MNNLRTLYVKFLTARVDTQSVLSEIDRLAMLGTIEGQRSALALQPKLEQALANEQQALTAYMNAVRGPDPRVITRSAFDALTPEKRMTFVKAGGKLVS